MKEILAWLYFIPLIIWWAVHLQDRWSNEPRPEGGDVPMISAIFNILSFVPVLNWYLILLIAIEIKKRYFKDGLD